MYFLNAKKTLAPRLECSLQKKRNGSPRASSDPIGFGEPRRSHSPAITPSSGPNGFNEARAVRTSAAEPSSGSYNSATSRLTASRATSLSFPKSRFLLCALGIFTGAAAISLSFMLIRLAGGIASTSFHWDTQVMQSQLLFLAVFTLVAISEEIFSRGYIQGLAKYHWGSRASILISSVLFAAFHVTNAGALDAGLPSSMSFSPGLISRPAGRGQAPCGSGSASI